MRHIEMGKGALRGGVRWLEGNRLHHRLDDAVSGGGLPAGVLHGRHFRAAAPRVCRRTFSAVLVSGFVSVTLTPMICSRYLRFGAGASTGWMYRTLENIMEAGRAGMA